MNLNTVKSLFGTIDIFVFSFMLFLSALIGIYYAYKDRRKSVTDYYYGGKKMSPFPVGISTAVSFISAITVMTYPADAYTYGTVVFWYSFTTIIPVIMACLYFIPLYHRLQLLTIYELLEKRFCVEIRKLSSAIEIINQISYMGFTTYLPALALNAVTHLKMSWTIALTGGICTFYTSLGGIKAVIWTDTLQASVMFSGVLAVFIKATIKIDGLENAWKVLEKNKANNFWNFNPDPRIRTTFWSVIFGFGCVQTAVICINQSVIQRYLSCKSLKEARRAAVYTLIPKISLSMFCILGGIVAYAYFDGCDPIKSKLLNKHEQIMPYLVFLLFHNMPGLAGFYVAAIYSATMSTVSSGINALAAQLLEDFVIPMKQNMSKMGKIIFSKVAVLFLGLCVTSIAYIATVLPGSVLKMLLLFRGACSGPLLGVFFLAMFFPWATSKGVLIGQIVGTIISMWIAVGTYVYGTSPELLQNVPHSADNCPVYERSRNFTTPVTFITETSSTTTSFKFQSENSTSYPAFYSLSVMYNSVVGFLTCMAVGLIVSFITGANKPRNVDPRYLVPIIENHRLPESVRLFFRFGVPQLEETCKSEDPEKLLMKSSSEK